VFDAGLYFEGDTSASYEDWEFFIRANCLGFSAVHAGSVGVRYRIRGISRLSECLANYDDLYDRMVERNRSAFEPRERTRIEHDEMPRFALVSLPEERAWLFTDPLAPHRRSIPLDELAWRFSEYLDEYPDSATYLAPIVLLAAPNVRNWLWSSPLAPGVLFRIQHALRTHTVVTVDAPMQLVAATFWEVIEGTDHTIGQLRELRTALVPARDFVRPESRHVDYEQTHSEFALRLAQSEQTTFPWAPARDRGSERDVFFVVSKLDGFDGAGLRALRLAQALTELADDVRLHLVVTGSTPLEVAEAALAPFATVTSLASIPAPEREAALLVVLGSADTVVDSGTGPVQPILPRLRRAATQSYAATLRRGDAFEGTLSSYESLIDHFLVTSERLARTCVNLGASPDKVVLVPNAPNVSPENVHEAERIAREKATRRAAGGAIRLLFVGEPNHDTGFDRLSPIGAVLDELDVRFELRVIDRSTNNPARSADDYLWADVFVLPSRRDAVPISVLDAMAFGCVVVATDVGEIPDVIEHGRNGLLVTSGAHESALIRSFAEEVRDVAVDATGSAAIRHAAAATAMSSTWEQSSVALLTALGASRA
jgi:glycosyltransferase involved in cell wall biosynthesis